jgi:hypothetical protein
MGWAHGADLGWGRRPKLHGMQGVKRVKRISEPAGGLARPSHRRVEIPGGEGSTSSSSASSSPGWRCVSRFGPPPGPCTRPRPRPRRTLPS